MRKPRNVQEFKALIEKYRSIKVEDIQTVINDPLYPNGHPMQWITGFGHTEECTLCDKSIHNGMCKDCVYPRYTGYHCTQGINRSTYNEIDDRINGYHIHVAINKRADHMEKVLDLQPRLKNLWYIGKKFKKLISWN